MRIFQSNRGSIVSMDGGTLLLDNETISAHSTAVRAFPCPARGLQRFVNAS
jgi:hypothetical protein